MPDCAICQEKHKVVWQLVVLQYDRWLNDCFIPCCTATYCLECANQIYNASCPVCRREVSGCKNFQFFGLRKKTESTRWNPPRACKLSSQ